MNDKSHLLDKLQLLILLDGRPDYQIANDCKVSPSTIFNIRRGKHTPSVVIAEKVYEQLSGYSLSDFEL